MHLTANGWWAIVSIAILSFLLNPLHYLSTGFVIWDLVRNVRSEREWFGIRVTRIGQTLILRYARACLVGLVGSIALFACGVSVTWQSIAYVSAMSIVLGVIRSRFAATPFAVAAAAVISFCARQAHLSRVIGWSWLHVVESFPIGAWLAIVAVSCCAECIMTFWGVRDAILPALLTSRRGRRIGALKLQLGYAMPVAVWMHPLGGHALMWQSGFHPWRMPLGQPIEIGILPLVFGLHAVFTGLRPQGALTHVRWFDLVRAMVAAAGFVLARLYAPLLAVWAAVALILIAEVFRFLWRRIDAAVEPLYTPNNRGVRVLYTIRGSLSDKIGIRPGEIVTHVNQSPVHTEYDIHFAMEQNPAYARFQVLDADGEVRLLSSPIFEGERHDLGLLLVVSSDEPALRLIRPFGFLETIYLRRAKKPHVTVTQPQAE
ncbi:hypothetical protein SAMN04489725_11460 [Alicyclobacillus hesperidum]|uniref:PDZ domain-containing protein n=1 Tax=Alicyclobacillus hesperidum TaxID=89784 RepID=A0A1H2WCM3_9BACL|nr:hypothetical protein [Alicyclobacillus hesperidum]SDW78291.1 hypothetical protein SAMN04489725_11460 [Alicyclobacillus hesperidum]